MTMFWTDAVQAAERLTGSVVNYDSKPTLIERVETGRSGPVALARRLGVDADVQSLSLDDKKWNNFRDLPRLGWFNYVGTRLVTPIYLERRAVNTRTHGICNNNTRTYQTRAEGVAATRDQDVTLLFRNAGYQETQHDESAYPPVSEILMSLDAEPSGISFSPKFCIVFTAECMKWLYRKTKRIGFFTGTDSLNLFPKMGFYKEELERCPTFDIQNVREF